MTQKEVDRIKAREYYRTVYRATKIRKVREWRARNKDKVRIYNDRYRSKPNE